MNRRKALGGIMALTGLGITTYVGFKYVKGTEPIARGQLFGFTDLIAELADVIIPPTDSPGAKQAQVQYFIIDYMESCATDKEYANFFHGLLEMQENCLEQYGADFSNCSQEQRNTIVQHMSEASFSMPILAKIDSKLRGRSCYALLRSLTIEGYCTSRSGVTEFLAYSPVPGKYNAKMNIAPDHKAWATQ